SRCRFSTLTAPSPCSAERPVHGSGHFSEVAVILCTATPPDEIYTLSLHDALPFSERATLPRASIAAIRASRGCPWMPGWPRSMRSEEHTSELQSLAYLVCRLLLEKKKDDVHHRDALPGSDILDAATIGAVADRRIL